MNPHNSKLVTILGLVASVAAAIGALTQWSALGNTGHVVILVLGVVGGIATALGKSLSAPAA
jgi:hypothetical protein